MVAYVYLYVPLLLRVSVRRHECSYICVRLRVCERMAAYYVGLWLRVYSSCAYVCVRLSVCVRVHAVACRVEFEVRRPRASTLGASNDPVFVKECRSMLKMLKKKRQQTMPPGIQDM